MKIELKLPFKVVRNDEAQARADARDELAKIVSGAKETLNKELKDAKKEAFNLTSDLKFWKQQFKKQASTKKCTKCKGEIDLWPFNSVAYHIKGTRVAHQVCPVSEGEE